MIGRTTGAESPHLTSLEPPAPPDEEPGDPMADELRAAEQLIEQGRLADAERVFRDLINRTPVGEGLLCAENPDARAGLAAVLRRQARFGDAEDEYRAARDGFAAARGADHPTTLAARQGLAGVLGEQGRLDAAETEYADVLEVSTRQWGPDHPTTVAVRTELEKVRLLLR